MQYTLDNIYYSRQLFIKHKKLINYNNLNYTDVKVDRILLDEILNRELKNSKEEVINSKSKIENKIEILVKELFDLEESFKKDEYRKKINDKLQLQLQPSNSQIAIENINKIQFIESKRLEIKIFKDKLFELNTLEKNINDLLIRLKNKDDSLKSTELRDTYFKLYQKRNSSIYNEKSTFDEKINEFKLQKYNRKRRNFTKTN